MEHQKKKKTKKLLQSVEIAESIYKWQIRDDAESVQVMEGMLKDTCTAYKNFQYCLQKYYILIKPIYATPTLNYFVNKEVNTNGGNIGTTSLINI